jgi:hypothetical protein
LEAPRFKDALCDGHLQEVFLTTPSKPFETGPYSPAQPQADEDDATLTLEEIQERRKWERVPAAIPLRLRKFEPMSWRSGACFDVCDGGLGLQTLEPLKIGELVEIELLGPDGVVHVCGRIVYRFANRYGLSFLGLSRLRSGPAR